MTYLISTATILLFLCISPLTTTAENTAVLDIDGHPLQADTIYYVLPVFRGRGGGLTLAPKNATGLEVDCPLYVAQDFEVSEGLPLKFYPVNPNDKTISVYTDMNVVFDVITLCIMSTQWQITFDDEGPPYVGTGGDIGNPGRETISNWFKIEKAGSGDYDYKFVYCPGVCDTCRPYCGELGIFILEDGTRLLRVVHDDQPLLVRFKKDTQYSSI